MSVRPFTQLATAYSVPAHPAPIDLVLSGNEGLAPPPWLDTRLDPEALARYPSTAPLEAELAARWGVDADQVLVTAGGDDALMRAFRVMLGPGREVVLPSPTFSMLPRFAAWTGAEPVVVSWTGDEWPLAEVLAACSERTGAIAVVSPNNPSGATVGAEQLLQLCAAVPDALVLVDAAYAEFADHDLTEVALTQPNAVVFRTLSKAWGLAGARVGYALGPATTIAWLRAAGLPYPCSAASLQVARRWLREGSAVVDATVGRVRGHRARLTQQLEDLGARVQRSQGNFVLARFDDAGWVHDGLAGLGIAVRRFVGEASLDEALRITVPAEPQVFARLCRALDAVLCPPCVLFDMDGVLVDVRDSYRAAIRQTAASYGVQVTATDIATAKRAGNANNDWVVTQRLVEAGGVRASLAEVTERFEARYQGGLWRRERPLVSPDALPTALPLGVVTGRPRRDAERFLAQHGFSDRFSVVVAMEDAPAKPSPEPVRRALERLGTTSGWLLGDTPDDLVAARAAGVVPIGVLAPGDTDATALFAAGASRVWSSPTALDEVLRCDA